MPRRGENIYKRKDGRWEGRYIKGHSCGKAQYGYVYAKTYKEVKEKLYTVKMAKAGDVGQEADEQIHEFEQAVPNFMELADEWLASIRPGIKESTYVKYANSLKSYLAPSFSSRFIGTISRADVSDFCAKLSKSGGNHKKGLAPKTINDSLSVLRSIFDFASREKALSVVDISGISMKNNRLSIRVLSMSEQKRLEYALYTDFNSCSFGILLSLYTGVRIGEICALRWGDISEAEHTLRVTRTMQRLQQLNEGSRRTKVIISSPKSECSIRTIPLPHNIFQLCKCRRKEDEAYVLTGKIHKYMEPRTMENRFKKILLKAGIEDATFHALRHTFATRCIEIGFDVKSLSEILGHASVNITMNRYVHPSMDLKQQNMNLLSNLFPVK